MSPSADSIRSIGILGAGRVATALARRAVAAGYDVRIATAKPAAEISLLAEIVTPGATAVDAADLARTDLTVVAIPLRKYRDLDPSHFAGRAVVDVMNYWAPTDGELADFEADHRTSSEVVQDHLAGALLVKAFNHIGYHDLEADHRPAGAGDRRALAVAGDHEDTRRAVATVIDRLGFDAVDAGPLAAGRVLQPGTEIFNGSHSAAQLSGLLAEACAGARV
ncbi:NAD(P)-binding domain-containing protein [Citricoccus sp. NPDC055426]|uniref:NADPH-dependent F420 reductase n=1 Tax=Citricoccus sp. NPDC055426 TaxID=3155536 RepID=UPI0034206660